MLAVLLLLPSPARAGEGTVHEVTGDKVRIRSGPGTRFPVVGHLDRDSYVVVVGVEGRWKKVRVPGGFACYVHESLVSRNDDGTADVTASRVLLRATAGKEHAPLVTRLERGDSVTVLDVEGEWLRVIPPDRAEAYVFDGLVRELGPADEYRAALARAADKRRKALLGDAPERNEKVRAAEAREARRKAVVEVGEKVLAGEGDAAELRDRLTRISLESDDDLTRGYANALLSLLSLREETERLERRLKKLDAERDDAVDEVRKQYEAAKKKYEEALVAAELLKSRREKPFRAVGTIEKRESGYVLVENDRVVYHLQSKRFRLADYVGKRAGVNGRLVVTDVEKGETHLLVEKLEILPGKATGRRDR